MRVVPTRVNPQPRRQPIAQPALRQHAANGLGEQTLGLSRQNYPRRRLSQPARIARIVTVQFVVELPAGEANFFRVDDDQALAMVGVGGLVRRVFAHQSPCRPRGQPAKHFALGVYDAPAHLTVARFGKKSRHPNSPESV